MSNRVAVVGAGAVGLFCAHFLQRAGHRVTIFERGTEPYDCCSIGNAGMVVPSHFEPLAAPGMVGYGLRMMLRRGSPFGMRPSLDPELLRWGFKFARSCTKANVEGGSRLLRDMHMASRAHYKELAEFSDNPYSLEECGLVMLCETESALKHELQLAERAAKLDLKVRELSASDVRAMEPNLELRAAGGVHFLDDCHLNPGRLLNWLREDLLRRGVEFRFGVEVSDFRREGSTIKGMRAGGEEAGFDQCVLAAGSWTGKLAKSLGIRMPLQAGKGYSVDLPMNPPPKHCFIFVEARVAVTPLEGALRFAGTMEITGTDLSINQSRFQGILNSVPKYMPELSPDGFQALKPWSGLRPCSADGLPYLGRAQGLSNVLFATGHSMMGISLAPISGQIIAQLASGTQPDYDLSALAPDRFN